MVEVRIASAGRPEDAGSIGDCAVRALTHYLDIPYAEVEALLLAQTNYDRSRGVTHISWAWLLHQLGFEEYSVKVRLTAKNAADKLPDKCLLVFARHVAYYENGVVYDLFNTLAAKGCKQTRAVFAIPTQGA